MLRKLITLILLTVACLSIVLAVDFIGFLKQPVKLADNISLFEVSPGAPLQRVANDLHNQGMLSRPWYWQILARFKGKAGEIKAGEYRLEHPVTPGQLLEQFVKGKTVQ